MSDETELTESERAVRAKAVDIATLLVGRPFVEADSVLDDTRRYYYGRGFTKFSKTDLFAQMSHLPWRVQVEELVDYLGEALTPVDADTILFHARILMWGATFGRQLSDEEISKLTTFTERPTVRLN